MVQIEMDKVRNLKFGINGMIELEKKMGKPLTSLGMDSFSLENIRTILYIGLKHEDKALNEDAVGSLMDLAIEKHGMNYVGEKLGEAFNKLMGSGGPTPISN